MALSGRIKKKNEVASPVEKPGLPLIGKIKVGQKTATGRPESLDYFLCSGKYASYFEKAHQQKPDVIQVVFISDDINYSCKEEYECRDSAGKLTGKGDGETWLLYNADKDDYLAVDNGTDEGKAALKAAGKWKAALTLRFIIPKIRGLAGVFEFTTHGEKSSIEQIRETFDRVQEQAKTVINIPFDLTVKKVKSQKPGQIRNFPVVQLVPNISEDNIAIVRNYLDSGNPISKTGLLNEERILQLKEQN